MRSPANDMLFEVLEIIDEGALFSGDWIVEKIMGNGKFGVYSLECGV